MVILHVKAGGKSTHFKQHFLNHWAHLDISLTHIVFETVFKCVKVLKRWCSNGSFDPCFTVKAICFMITDFNRQLSQWLIPLYLCVNCRNCVLEGGVKLCYMLLHWRHVSAMASQITSNSIIFPKVCLGQQQRKHNALHFCALYVGNPPVDHRWISLANG